LLRKKSLVVVEGILPRIKYTKNRQGGDPVKQEIPVSIHVSNVMLWDSEKNVAEKLVTKWWTQKSTLFQKIWESCSKVI
jgi:ribosomal protein L24